MTTTTRLYSAALDFSPRWNRAGEIDRWIARPVGDGQLIDRTYGEPVAAGGFTCVISVEELPNGSLQYEVATQGREPAGRRYRWFRDAEQAFSCAETWAARRFGYRVATTEAGK